MPLCISVPQPHFGVNPVQFIVIWSPNWVVLAGFLLQLNGYWQDVSIASDVKQSQSWACVTTLKFLIKRTVVWNVVKNLVINNINTTIL